MKFFAKNAWSEWAEKFPIFLKLAVLHSKNKNYDVAYKAFDALMNCIYEAAYDTNILGTDEPMEYIEIDWDAVFEEYYLSMRHQISDQKQLAGKAIGIWINLGGNYTDSLVNQFDSITYIEESIRKNIANQMDSWYFQHELYELLRKFYLKSHLEFNEVIIAKSLVCYNLHFLNDVAQGLMSAKMWDEAVQIIKEALGKVTERGFVPILKEKLVVCYENLGMFSEAYDIAAEMFMGDSRHELYLKARSFAVINGSLENFIEDMENHFRKNKEYGSTLPLLKILSFEGQTLKLIDTALKNEDYFRYDYLKYALKSLVYRVLGSEEISLPDLKGFLQSIGDNEMEGIVDMVKIPISSDDKQFLLNNAIDILKQMVQFHIDAANRSRYANAAYYCAIIRDIYTYRNEKDEFDRYYGETLIENKRRSALKDEFKKKLFQNG